MSKYEQFENPSSAPHQELIPPGFDDSDIEVITASGEKADLEGIKQNEPGRQVQERIINAAVDKIVQEKFPGLKGPEAERIREEFRQSADAVLKEDSGVKEQWLRALTGDVQEGRFDKSMEGIEEQLAEGFMRRLKERIEH